MQEKTAQRENLVFKSKCKPSKQVICAILVIVQKLSFKRIRLSDSKVFATNEEVSRSFHKIGVGDQKIMFDSSRLCKIERFFLVSVVYISLKFSRYHSENDSFPT